MAGTASVPPRAPARRRLEVLTVYAVGLFQGLSLVAVPAAATILTSVGLRQVVMAILGSLALPALSRRFGLKRVLLAGIVADLVAMSVLVAAMPSNTMRWRFRCSSFPPQLSDSASGHARLHQYLRRCVHARSA